MLGRSALKPTPGEEYAKIECQRTTTANNAR
jgi:hypothetical protein